MRFVPVKNRSPAGPSIDPSRSGPIDRSTDRADQPPARVCWPSMVWSIRRVPLCSCHGPAPALSPEPAVADGTRDVRGADRGTGDAGGADRAPRPASSYGLPRRRDVPPADDAAWRRANRGHRTSREPSTTADNSARGASSRPGSGSFLASTRRAARRSLGAWDDAPTTTCGDRSMHGARAVASRVKTKHVDRRSRWLKALIARRGINRASSRYANKTARMAWALVTRTEEYAAV